MSSSGAVAIWAKGRKATSILRASSHRRALRRMLLRQGLRLAPARKKEPPHPGPRFVGMLAASSARSRQQSGPQSSGQSGPGMVPR